MQHILWIIFNILNPLLTDKQTYIRAAIRDVKSTAYGTLYVYILNSNTVPSHISG
jgi:hypothetical protein